MSEKQLNSSQYNPNFLSKTSSTRSCQNLLCLTKRCNEDQTKEKQRILNHHYFQKLSLKKFYNSSLINQSYYEKDKVHQRSLKRDKSTEDSEFQNIVINLNKQDQFKYTNKNVNDSKKYNCFNQTHRIVRCQSQRQLESHQPNATERSISKELEHDYRKIQDLSRLRRSLEAEIRSLDQNIDKYYYIYNSKLQQLKKIQSSINQIGDQERMMKRVPSNDDLKGFRKKSFWDQFNGTKLGANQKNLDNTYAPKDHRPFNSYKKHPSFYESNANVGFVKKAF